MFYKKSSSLKPVSQSFLHILPHPNVFYHRLLCGLSASSFLFTAWALFFMPWGFLSAAFAWVWFHTLPNICLSHLSFWSFGGFSQHCLDPISQIWPPLPCPVPLGLQSTSSTLPYVLVVHCLYLFLTPKPRDFLRLRADAVTFLLLNISLLCHHRTLGLLCRLQMQIAHFLFLPRKWAT